MQSATNYHDSVYLDSLKYIRDNGEVRGDRTGTGTISVFGTEERYDLRKGFPLLTTKFVHFHSIKHELKWMLSGSSDIKYLKDNNVSIWDSWVKPETVVYKRLGMFARLELLRKKNGESYEDLLEVKGMMVEDGRSQEFIDRIMTSKLDQFKIPEQVLLSGDLGPVYGKQWRCWEDIDTVPSAVWYNSDKYQKLGYTNIGTSGMDIVVKRNIDQIAIIEDQLRNDPFSRRIILNGWNVSRVDSMALPPCHTLAQWYVSTEKCGAGKNYIDCKLYMRSNDVFLGKPFNVAQYALLTHMLAHVHGFTPRYYIHSTGDAHIYANHIDQVNEQLSREVIHPSPKLFIERDYLSILDISADAISIQDYKYLPSIKAPVAV